MKTRFSPRLLLVAVATTIGLATTAFAMPPQGDTLNGHGGGMMHERHLARGMKAMSRLHDELKLDAKQEALWKEAETASKENRTGMRERFSKHHEEIRTMLNQPGADLRAITKRMSELKAEGQKQHEAQLERWLTVYDVLNAEQKEKVRLFFKDRADHSRHFGKRENAPKQ